MPREGRDKGATKKNDAIGEGEWDGSNLDLRAIDDETATKSRRETHEPSSRGVDAKTHVASAKFERMRLRRSLRRPRSADTVPLSGQERAVVSSA